MLALSWRTTLLLSLFLRGKLDHLGPVKAVVIKQLLWVSPRFSFNLCAIQIDGVHDILEGFQSDELESGANADDVRN